ncbi:hypothetical protein HYPSUDRAFT_206148 [Hypholoma sublateritium FD-334 SS-4]|uniref:SAM domain-containing protein n=1 Tax=Hypholoma sublateritium (strain FD-334 SS-4) TaxID=945553 RepID=A0A0D2KSB9_HYPSF|nr:hypothetical protein HYPSUDRAFT_206148 [Hypholoma sublateritium FD-334 SS-4]
MVRGQTRKKPLCTRPAPPTTSGRRKSAKSIAVNESDLENINPTRLAEPAKERPKPRPQKKAILEEEAVRALVSLQNRIPTASRASLATVCHTRSLSPPAGPPTSGDTEDGTVFDDEDIYGTEDEVNEEERAVFSDEESDGEEEIDQLDRSSDVGESVHGSSQPSSPTPLRMPFFVVPFVVPYRKASRDVDGITSKTTFPRVLRLILERMEVPLTLLGGIGYVPSYKPKSSKPVPKLLEDERSWTKLLEDVHAFTVTCKGKNGKGAIKPFHITIVDTTASSSEADSKAKKKKAGTDAPPVPALTFKETAHISAMKTLENRHMCQQHKKPCLIQLDGVHYHLTMNDITKWAHLMAENKALLDTPPAELNITDFTPRQHLAKKAAESQSQSSGAAFPDWMEKLVGMMVVGNVATANRVASLSMNSSPLPLSAPLTAPATALKWPSSPVEYPELNTWLIALENHPVRQKKARGFSCYAESLVQNGIDDLEDLLRLTSSEVMSIIPNINIGIAKRLLAFAEEDVTDIQDRKRLHYS